jgi:outer membrane receptor for ferrienterochelin and colicins
VVPSLNLRYEIGPGNHILRASYARGFRAPSLKELYLYFVDINHNLRGNPDLEAEYSHNFNLTWDHNRMKNTNRFTFQAGLFYNSINNRITLALDSATQYTYINVDQYKTAGGKLNFKYTLHPRFTFQAGLFQVARKSIIGEGSGLSTPYRHSTDVTSSTSYNWLSRKLRFLISYKFTGKQPQFYSNEEGEIAEGFIESFHMMDISATKAWWNERIVLGLGVNNIFDYTNIESSGLASGAHTSGAGTYPVGWGRSFFVSLRFNIQKFN